MRTNPLGSAGARCRHAEEHWVHTRPAAPPRLPSHPLLSLAGRLQVPVDALRLAGLEPNTEDRVEQRLGRRWPKAAAIGGFRQAPERRRSLSPVRMRRGLASRVKRVARCKRAGLWSGGRAAWAAASPTIVRMRSQAGCTYGYRLRREQLRLVCHDALDYLALHTVAAAHLLRGRVRAERRAPEG